MKKFLTIAAFLWATHLSAQFYIGNGALVKMTGTGSMTLHQIDLVNEGTFNQTEGTVLFTGNSNNSIGGGSVIRFYNLEIAKPGSNRLILLRTISIDNEVNCNGGIIDLNGSNILLASTALLVGENENSRISGAAGGYVQITGTLNNPSAANLGNLGAIITSAANMGSTIIRRGHQSQVNGSGGGSSILRYYDITPTNNTGLNASLRFQYFNAELNSLNENLLTLWKSNNNTSWTNEGFNSRNTITNYVEKTGIPGFSRWTLSTTGTALPVQFILFAAKCDNGSVVLNWKTAIEQNSSHFEVQRSDNSLNWVSIGTVPAAGYSNTEKSYQFTDNNPAGAIAYYRIAEFDMDGRSQYTHIIKNECGQANTIRVFPNPVINELLISFTATVRSDAWISIYDSKGALILQRQTELPGGNNMITLDMRKLPKGIYHVTVNWDKGNRQQSFKIVKQ